MQQASCTKKGRDAGFKMLSDFIEEMKANGTVQNLIDKYGVTGRLTVAPPRLKANSPKDSVAKARPGNLAGLLFAPITRSRTCSSPLQRRL